MTTLIVTEAAASYIRQKVDGKGLRISVKKTGCSGYSYVPAIAENINANDTVITAAAGVTIYLDTSWLHLLDGIKIDYVEEDKSGLKQKRLVFTNEKESGRCGCGESFHIDEVSGVS
jgi:iron-sulfur cluster assembly protein